MKPLIDDLRTRLAGLALEPATIARIYNAAKPLAWPHALTGGDAVTLLQEAAVLLGGALSPDGDSLPPVLDFVHRLMAETSEPWLTRLRSWLDEAVQRLGADAAQRDRMKARVAAAPSGVAPERVQVLVRIRTTASDQWLVHAWYWAGIRLPESLFGAEGRRFKHGSSEDVVYDLVDELEARNVDPESTSIAFIVPRALACEAIHAWRLAESVVNDPPLGVSYTVTLRPLERLERQPLLRRRFKRAWEDVKQRGMLGLAWLDPGAAITPAGVRAVVLDAADALRSDLAQRLEAHDVRCVVLRDPPCATALAHLSAVLDTTAPAILWHRDYSAAPADVEQSLRELLQKGPLADLPRRVRNERSAAYADETRTHRGMNLMLIWDDTDYMPPEHEPGARAAVETI
jgi:hypothetical protein